MKKRKRKEEQVNYSIRRFAHEHYVASFAITKKHPLWSDSYEFRVRMRDELGIFVDLYMGNSHRTKGVVKEKFRNLNYKVFSTSAYYRSADNFEQFKEKALKFRWGMMEEYIKHKRKEG